MPCVLCKNIDDLLSPKPSMFHHGPARDPRGSRDAWDFGDPWGDTSQQWAWNCIVFRLSTLTDSAALPLLGRAEATPWRKRCRVKIWRTASSCQSSAAVALSWTAARRPTLLYSVPLCVNSLPRREAFFAFFPFFFPRPPRLRAAKQHGTAPEAAAAQPAPTGQRQRIREATPEPRPGPWERLTQPSLESCASTRPACQAASTHLVERKTGGRNPTKDRCKSIVVANFILAADAVVLLLQQLQPSAFGRRLRGSATPRLRADLTLVRGGGGQARCCCPAPETQEGPSTARQRQRLRPLTARAERWPRLRDHNPGSGKTLWIVRIPEKYTSTRSFLGASFTPFQEHVSFFIFSFMVFLV